MRIVTATFFLIPAVKFTISDALYFIALAWLGDGIFERKDSRSQDNFYPAAGTLTTSLHWATCSFARCERVGPRIVTFLSMCKRRLTSRIALPRPARRSSTA